MSGQEDIQARWRAWCRQKDARGFEDTANHLQPELIGYAGWHTRGDQLVAASVVNRVLMELVGAQDAPDTLHKLRGWLKQRIKRRIADARRACGRHPTLPLAGASAAPGGAEVCDRRPGPADEVAEAEARDRLARRLEDEVAGLPESLGFVVRELFYEGHTLAAVAGQMGCSVSWVGRLRDRALLRLRDRLAGPGGLETAGDFRGE